MEGNFFGRSLDFFLTIFRRRAANDPREKSSGWPTNRRKNKLGRRNLFAVKFCALCDTWRLKTDRNGQICPWPQRHVAVAGNTYGWNPRWPVSQVQRTFGRTWQLPCQKLTLLPVIYSISIFDPWGRGKRNGFDFFADFWQEKNLTMRLFF